MDILLLVALVVLIGLTVHAVGQARQVAAIRAQAGQAQAAAETSETKLADMEIQITGLAEALRHAPGDEHIARIHNRIDQVGQGVKHLEGQMQAVTRSLDLIQQSLMRADK